MPTPDAQLEEGRSEARAVPIAIASRATEDTSFGDDGAFLVGSPEQVSQLSAHYSSPHLSFVYGSQGQEPPQSRPGIDRSVSSPQGLALPTPSSSPRFSASTIFRRSPKPPREREWSVFGELMSGEGRGERHLQVPSFSASGSFKHGAQTSSSSSITPTPSPIVEGEPSSFPETVQSPSQESQFVGPDNGQSYPSMERVFEPQTLNDRRSQSDSDSDDDTNTRRSSSPKHSWLSCLPTLPTLTPLHKNILKCSVAYFIGSLFTFSPYLSGFITDITSNGPGDNLPSPSAHMVATVSVQFLHLST